MIFTIRDLELMQTLRWCRYADPAGLMRVFGKTEVSNLISIKLIKKHKSRGYLSLAIKGNSLIEKEIRDCPEYIQLPYRAQHVERRVRAAKIMLTAYSAGICVFIKKQSALSDENGYYLTALRRGRGANPWSNSRIAALLRLGDMLYGAHYVCEDIGNMLIMDEMNAFMNNTSQFRNVRRALLFAGESYEKVLSELDKAPEKESANRVSYSEAYRQINIPIYLLPCDTTGSMQLRLMSIPDYRQVLARAALKSQYCPAPKENPEWDAMFEGNPFIVAADMELRRLDRAIRSAREQKLMPVSMLALKPQVDAVLKRRYRDKGLARVFTLKEDTLRELGINQLYTPPSEPFRTEKGEVIDAPLIKADRKS